MDKYKNTEQLGLFEETEVRSLLDQLLSDARLYKTSKDYEELLDFVAKLPNFAPFNAMLLQLQKPGLTYAASAYDWKVRFGCYPKEDARPLIILWPFGPVAFVYDVMDIKGAELPEDVSCFFARGKISKKKFDSFEHLLSRKKIKLNWFDGGDAEAGSISVIQRPANKNGYTQYKLRINKNHDLPIRQSTLTHELGHLFLGHLGQDKKLNIPDRRNIRYCFQELEAESVAYIVCKRNGIDPKSHTYLSAFVEDKNLTTEQLDIYQIMRAAGQVETILGLTTPTKFEYHKGIRYR